MAEEEQLPPQRVVKKVVKKAVVRPVSPASTSASAAAESITAPPVVTSTPAAPATPRLTTSPAPTATTSVIDRADASATPEVAEVAPTAAQPPKKSGPSLGAKLGDTRHVVGDTASDAVFAVREFFARCVDWIVDRFWAVVDWRLPLIDPTKASAITGLFAALLATGLGSLALMFFSAVRGTSAGGGRWGLMVFTAITALVFLLGAWLLDQFGVAAPRATSALAVGLALTLVMLFFMDLIAGSWAWLVLPALCIAAFVAAERLLALAAADTDD